MDVFRGLAALSVVLFHYTSKYNEFYGHSDTLWMKFPSGHLGINLFFIISGFVIFMTLENAKRPIDFVVSRFSRLFPAYWTAILITFTIVTAAGITPAQETTVGDALMNLTMFQGFLSVLHIRVHLVDNAYWTLSVELCFYIFLFTIYSLNILQSINYIAMLWLLMVAANRLVYIPWIIEFVFLLKFAHLFIAGMMFYKIRNGKYHICEHLIILLCLLFEIIICKTILHASIITGLFAIFYLFVYDFLSIISVRPLIFLGTISYSLYLVHQNIGYVIIKYLYTLNVNPNLTVVISIIASLLLASSITFLIEKPAMRAIKSKFDRGRFRLAFALLCLFPFLFLISCSSSSLNDHGWPREVQEVKYRSSGDETYQPALFYAPAKSTTPAPLLVALHTWSNNYLDNGSIPYSEWAITNAWAFIHPDFRGANHSPEATGSDLVVADLRSAVEYARKNASVDPRRIYLIGCSGGGYTALLAAARLPEIWAAASVWVPITDLVDWYHECKLAKRRYAEDIARSCAGPPGIDPQVSASYRKRSPSTYLKYPSLVPLDINAGIMDGHTGSVPISHSLNAFNLSAQPEDRISEEEIKTFAASAQVPFHLQKDLIDETYGSNRPLFRRQSQNVRITIFDGGHQIIYKAALTWLSHQKKTTP